MSFLGETPLHIAIFYNDISSVQLLVKHGVDVNERVVGGFYSNGTNGNRFETRSGRKRAPSKFFQHKGSPKKVITLKNANPESKSHSFEFILLIYHLLAHAYYGEYPLAFAAAFGYIEIYDYLIDHGADPNKQDTYGNTVLHMLIIRDNSV